MGSQHFDHWPESVPKELGPLSTSLWYNLEVSARRYPDKPAIIFYDRVLTYRELEKACLQLAGYLQQVCGVKRGDRVALNMQNSPQFVIGYYATLRADAMVVPINPMSVPKELSHVMTNSGARVMISSQELLPRTQPVLRDGKFDHLIVGTYADYLPDSSSPAIPLDIAAPPADLDGTGAVTMRDALAQDLKPSEHLAGPDDLCVMPYTSGTTGLPKGCTHRHRNAMHTAILWSEWHRCSQEEVTLAVLPFFHVTGMQNSMNGPIYRGGTLVILPRWNRETAAALIKRHRVTGWTSVPTMIVDLLSSPTVDQYDLSSLRALGGGGAAMPQAIAKKLRETCGIEFTEGYGLSETMAATHINPKQRAKRGCLGIPACNVDSRIIDPETLKEVEPGQEGEIVSHGPQVFEGYWNNSEATDKSFIELDGKRFFRTGDLARCDEDGYFYMVDRLKRMINAAGFKVWPAEVEATLYGHPAIKEVAIISTKDARRGERVKAMITLHAELAEPVTEAEIIAWSRERMAAYKIPRSVEFVHALPKSATGKIMWRALQEQEDAKTQATDDPK